MVEAAPDEAVHADYHEGDEDGGEQEDGEAAAVGGGVDLGAEADGLEGAVAERGSIRRRRRRSRRRREAVTMPVMR